MILFYILHSTAQVEFLQYNNVKNNMFLVAWKMKLVAKQMVGFCLSYVFISHSSIHFSTASNFAHFWGPEMQCQLTDIIMKSRWFGNGQGLQPKARGTLESVWHTGVHCSGLYQRIQLFPFLLGTQVPVQSLLFVACYIAGPLKNVLCSLHILLNLATWMKGGNFNREMLCMCRTPTLSISHCLPAGFKGNVQS